MKERPILFSGAMIRTILEGRKSQTRRVWKKQPYKCSTPMPNFKDTAIGDLFICPDLFPTEPGPVGSVITECTSIGSYHSMGSQAFIEKHGPKAYGVLGDRLWVRETWAYRLDHDNMSPTELIAAGVKSAWFWADGPGRCCNTGCAGAAGRVRASMHLPRAYSRITLEITDVRVQRVQEISESDAEAEGISTSVVDPSPRGVAPIYPKQYVYAKECFRDLWDSINAKRGFGWDSNPWVWALTFRKEA